MVGDSHFQLNAWDSPIAVHDPTIYLIRPPRSTSNVYRYKYIYRLPLNIHSQNTPWLSRLERQSSKPKVVGSSPVLVNNFSFCNSRFHYVAGISSQPIQGKREIPRDVRNSKVRRQYKFRRDWFRH